MTFGYLYFKKINFITAEAAEFVTLQKLLPRYFAPEKL